MESAMAATEATTARLPRDERTRQKTEAESPLVPGFLRETSEPASAVGDGKQSQGKSRRRLRSVLAALLVASLAGGGYLYWDTARRFESTDDAFIASRQFSVAPKVAGYIAAVPVTDNQHVVAGQVIARIDDRDYRTALAQAEAQVQAAQASITNLSAQIEVQKAQVAESVAQVANNKANLDFAGVQKKRYDNLARQGAIALQAAQQNDAALLEQQASLDTAKAGVTAAQRQIAALAAQRGTAEANLAQALAQLQQAKLNLSYTTITAAQAGRVTNLTGAVGQYAAAGTTISMFVPAEQTWVTANFKENQLDRMRPGDVVRLRVDAYPERALHGHVASVQAGSGTAFSLLPAENATGNYVKIVQRVPVKITIDNLPEDVTLGPGMSVTPIVRVDPRPSLFEKVRAWL
jgi:membrane fusion protein, multidrug efflux system